MGCLPYEKPLSGLDWLFAEARFPPLEQAILFVDGIPEVLKEVFLLPAELRRRFDFDVDVFVSWSPRAEVFYASSADLQYLFRLGAFWDLHRYLAINGWNDDRCA